MKYISLLSVFFILFSCKKEKANLTSSIDPTLTTSKVTASFKGVIVAKGLFKPRNLYVNAKCDLYIVEQIALGDRLSKWPLGSTHGEIVVGDDHSLHHIRGIYADKKENLFITGSTSMAPLNYNIFKFLPGEKSGQSIFDISSAFNNGLMDSKTDSKGVFYIAGESEILKWMPGNATAVIVAGDGAGPAPNQFSLIQEIDFDVNGALYVADFSDYIDRIQKWEIGASAGVTVASADGSLNFRPLGVAVDQNSNVYVADYANRRIIQFSPGSTNGVVIIDRTTPGIKENFNPSYLFCDKKGSLYISDLDNGEVSKWTQ
jgi:hypothetical protein